MSRGFGAMFPFFAMFIAAHAVKDNADSTKLTLNANDIACPVLASLYNAGKLEVDEYGRTTNFQLEAALQQVGASWPCARFQAMGVAAYEESDKHQESRGVGLSSFVETKYLNVFTMHAHDACPAEDPLKSTGFPCNANQQCVQHGYSTTLRDTFFDSKDPDGRQRFDFWIGDHLVERKDLYHEPIMLIDGFLNLLKKARHTVNPSNPMLASDFSGEYSYAQTEAFRASNIFEYHQSMTQAEAKFVSTWQPMFAWSGFWAAFHRKKGDTTFLTKSDLASIFIEGELPTDYEIQPWGFEDAFDLMAKMEGTGIGNEWASVVKPWTERWSFGQSVNETRLNVGMLTSLVGLGIHRDDGLNPLTGRRRNAPDMIR